MITTTHLHLKILKFINKIIRMGKGKERLKIINCSNSNKFLKNLSQIQILQKSGMKYHHLSKELIKKHIKKKSHMFNNLITITNRMDMLIIVQTPKLIIITNMTA